MKSILLGAARLAIALFLAGIGLAAVIAGYSWVQDANERKEAKPYESITEWSSDLQENLGFQLRAKTKLVAGKLLLSVDLIGYPSYLSDPRLSERNKKAQLAIHFLDSDGFQLFSKPIQIAEFTSVVDAKGNNSGLRVQAQDYLALDNYKRFQRLEVEWTLVTKLPPDPVASAKNESSRLDHCAPNLSRAERLRRLSMYGELRETGLGNYSAGSRIVHFFSDGSLLVCQ